MHAAVDQPLDILVIEQEAEARQMLVEALQGAGHRIAPFANTSECARDAAPTRFDLAFIPESPGAPRSALTRLCQRCPRMRIVLTASDAIPATARLGGHEVVGWVRKPVPIEYAQQLARCVAELRAMEEELAILRGSASVREAIPFIEPRNTRMRRVLDRARQVAGDRAPLLLRGEFGAGKKMLGGLIHQWGPNPQSPWILLRSASMGSPTSPREAAERIRLSISAGTLLLEEIGDFTLAQQKEIFALVSTCETDGDPEGTLPAGIRVIATSSQDLSAAVRKGEFREDLLSLLQDEALYIPPLHERPEDIVSLAEQMLAHFRILYHRPELSLEPEAKLALGRYPWPGNVHELRNAVEGVALTARKPEIGESEFRLRAVADPGRHRTGSFLSLDAVEKQQIVRVMRASPTLEEAARVLQVDITTLWRKRRRYGI